MWKIYKHTLLTECQHRGWSYIGQTVKKKAEWRWETAGKGYNKQPKFWNAIKKYGWDSFSHEILKDNIKTAEEATFWEDYYIKLYDSINNGYNNHEAGINGSAVALYKSVYQYSLTGKFIKKFDSLTEAWETTGIAFGSISKACDEKLKSAGGYMWRWSYIEQLESINRLTNAKTIYQYDLTGNLLAVYNSGKEAEIKTGISRSYICSCAKGIVRTAGNFVWRYENEAFSYIPNGYNCKVKNIDQFDLNGQFIRTFISAKAAVSALGIVESAASRINEVCRGKRKTCAGFIWRWHDPNNEWSTKGDWHD